MLYVEYLFEQHRVLMPRLVLNARRLRRKVDRICYRYPVGSVGGSLSYF